MSLLKKVVALLLPLTLAQAGSSVPMAVTVDDLPTHELPSHSLSRYAIVDGILKAFDRHGLKNVYGFGNAGKIPVTPRGAEIYELWVKAGQLLGNHTLNHPWLARTEAADYIEEIRSNQILLDEYQTPHRKWFRYPFLAEGNTLEKRNTVRNFLANNDYSIAQVTIDSNDWAWNDPYTRCLNLGDEHAQAWLKKTFLQNAIEEFRIMRRLSRKLWGRETPHVLLTHVGSLTSVMMDELLSAYEKEGARFVTLEEAQADPLYREDPGVTMEYGLGFLQQWAQKRNIPVPRNNKRPDIRVLEQICR
jgi:peptidoglycan-N-acetylglucosamine deacetylase